MDRTTNADLCGHLAVASLFALNILGGSYLAALAAPLTWWLAQMAEAQVINVRLTYSAVVLIQIAAAGNVIAMEVL